MLVSFVIPLYKGKIYIKHILEMIYENYLHGKSIINNLDVEVIFVNDYPTDNVVLQNRYKELFVNVINNDTNNGIHKSRVIGLNNSSGEYICFFDQDDELSSDFLIFAMECLVAKKSDIVVVNGYLDKDGKKTIIYRNSLSIYLSTKFQLFVAFRNMIISPGQCLIKKDKIPVEWKEHILVNNGSDDYLLWILLGLYKAKVNYVNKFLYYHVQTGKNVSNNINSIVNSNLNVIKTIESITTIKTTKKKRIKKYLLLNVDFTKSENKLLFFCKHPIYFLKRAVFKFIVSF